MNTKQARICELRQSGMTMGQVAKEVGCSKSYVKQVCVKNGIRIPLKCDPTKLVEERNPQFEYVDGFTNCDGMVNIRCKVCGHVQRRSLITIRHKNIVCENCERLATEEKAKQEEQQRSQQRSLEAERKEWEKAVKRKAKQLSFAVCECCGSLFFPTSGCNKKYCSAECADKHHNSTKKDRRMRKLSTVMVDKDITLKDLFKRDGGVCAICGKRCRWEDKEERADGTIVTYKDYPSVDHIVPLSKGGKHAWDNIQLACRSCNSRKGDRF